MDAGEKKADPWYWEKPMASYLIRCHSDQLLSIACSPHTNLHFPLYIDFAELMDDDPRIAHLVFTEPTTYLQVFDQAAIWAQKIVLADLEAEKSKVEKQWIHVRINISGSPLECPETFPSIGRVRVEHRGILLTVKGTVIRSGAIKMHEGERKYMCHKCQKRLNPCTAPNTFGVGSLPSSI